MVIKTDKDVQDQIRLLAMKGHKPTEIIEMLDVEPKYDGRVPDIRTIQRYARTVRRASDAWSFLPKADIRRAKRGGDAWQHTSTSPEDAGLVMDSIAKIFRETAGKVSWVSEDEARLIVWLRRAFFPEFPIGPVQAYMLAVEYLRPGSNTKAIDTALAIRYGYESNPKLPWEIDVWQTEFKRAVDHGEADAVPDWITVEEPEAGHVVRRMNTRGAIPVEREPGMT